MFKDFAAKLAASMAWPVVRENIVMPLLRRVGTMAGTALVAVGADSTLTEQAFTGFVALGLIGFDLLLARLQSKKGRT